MTLTAPRSLPPPVLPPRVAAETRIKALRADLEGLEGAALRAAVQYEIAALTETRLGDREAALRGYQESARTDPGFRPPLFALARLLREERAYTQLSRVLEALVHASRTPADSASTLVELGILLADHLDDPSAAGTRFEQALERDPASRAAALMLERLERQRGSAQHVHAAVALRAQHTRDPALRAALLCEVAEEQLTQGHVDDAITTLLTAAALPVPRYSLLERVAEIGRAHGRHAVAAQALDDMAELLRVQLHTEPSAPALEHAELTARFADRDACKQQFVWLKREVGRLHWLHTGDLPSARAAYESAREYAPDDVLLALDHVSVCELSGDMESARALLHGLLASADPRRTAALHFHLAELAEQQGDRVQARAHLRSALGADPSAPAVLAVLEDALVDERSFGELCDHLLARAEHGDPDEQRMLLTRAAAIAAGPARDPARAIPLYRVLIEQSRDKLPLLRELYGAALRANDPEAILSAAAALLEQDLEPAEASALVRARYAALLGAGDTERAYEVLREALTQPACARWAPHTAAVMAAGRRDHAVLAQAHAQLAEQTDDAELAAAHLCARARALTRLGKSAEASAVLQRVIELSPGNTYAVALLEELLHAAGDATEAVHLLREAAASAHSARKGELALLHAGAAAESAGRVDLAARSYEEAAEREPDALSPLWALRRLGQRAGDKQLELAAIQGMATREQRLGDARYASLELAERYDLLDKAELAAAPLRAAAQSNAAFEAHVAAFLLPETQADPSLQDDALRWLQTHVSEDARTWLERERIAQLVHTAPHDAELALAALASASGATPSDELLRFMLARTPSERAGALRSFGELCHDPDARAELALHATRVQSYGAVTGDADALVSALSALEDAPQALASAVALDEALGPNDDAELRVRTLKSRLTHTLPEASLSSSAALARALLDAGRAAEAATLARELVREDPTNVDAWETLRVAARSNAELESVVGACDALAQAAEGEARALLLEEAAALLEEELARPAEAEPRLRAALEADAGRLSVFERLHDLLLTRHDFDALLALVSARVRVAASEDERSDLLYEQARLLRGLGEREAALACIDEVLAIQPTHAGALGLAAEVHASLSDWSAAIAVLRALAQADAPESQRRLARQGAADFFERHVRDLPSAYHELSVLAREGLADLGTYRRMADLAQRAQLLPEAVEALAQAAKLSGGELRAALERRAGEILARDPGRQDLIQEARLAYTRALAALPTDIDACEALCGLVTGPERHALLVQFTTHSLASLGRDPVHAPQLRALRRAALLAADTTLEHVTLGALRALALASPEELEAHAQLDASMLTVPDEVWAQEHFAALSDPSVPAAAWRFASIACKAWLDANRDAPGNYGVDRQDRVGGRAPHALRDALAAWTASFGLRVSELYVGGKSARAITMMLQPGHAQAWVAGKDLRAPLDKRTRFIVAEHCAASRMGVLPLVRLERTAARDILFAAWAALTPALVPEAEAVRTLATRLSRAFSRAQRRELEECLKALPDAQLALDAVLEAARMLCLRAGLVASGDPSIALEAVLGAHFDPALIPGSAPAVALLRFWTSNTLVALRRELGLRA